MYSILQGFRFAQRWLWTLLSSGTQCRIIHWNPADNSEESSSWYFILRIFFNPKDGGEILLKTVFNFQRNTQLYIQEYRTLHVQFCRMRFEVFTVLKGHGLWCHVRQRRSEDIATDLGGDNSRHAKHRRCVLQVRVATVPWLCYSRFLLDLLQPFNAIRQKVKLSL